MAEKPIKVPRVVWALGDREQSTQSGVTTERRPLYHKGRRVGELDPDYAGIVFAALEKSKK